MSEAQGLLLSVILDGAAERSALLVVDAETLAKVARADLPNIVPFHCHGRHIEGPELRDAST